jgi:hypothetical protein
MSRRFSSILPAVLAGLWGGAIASIALIAAPSAFAVLARADAGRFVGRVFELEAHTSLAIAALLFVIERQRTREAAQAGQGSALSANLVLLLGTLFCTVAGHYALLPMIEAARAGQGSLSFGALHAISVVFFVLKGLLVLALAWRLCAAAGGPLSPSATS